MSPAVEDRPASPPDPHEARMNKKAAEKSTTTTETSNPPRSERDGATNSGGFGRGGQRIAIEAGQPKTKSLEPQKLKGLAITRFQRDADVPTPAATEAQPGISSPSSQAPRHAAQRPHR